MSQLEILMGQINQDISSGDDRRPELIPCSSRVWQVRRLS